MKIPIESAKFPKIPIESAKNMKIPRYLEK